MIINYRQAVPVEYSKTLLLLHGEAFEDSSAYSRDISNSGATISSSQKKFGESSLYFDGNSKILVSDPIDFGNNDFTIDWWEYCTGTPGTRFSNAWTPGSTWGGLLIGFSGNSIYASSRTNEWDLINSAQIMSVTLNQWVHWAIVRNGNTLKSYRNGSEYGSVSINGAPYFYSDEPMVIGSYREQDQNPFYGYIDEFRISNVARWTSNFTPPIEPYTE